MGLTLDQALGQLDITAVAFQRIEIPGTVLPPAAPGQVHFIAVLSGSGQLDCADGPMPVTEGQLLLLPREAAPRPGNGLVLAHGLLGATLLDGRSLFEFLSLPHRQEAGGTELFTGAIPEMLREAAHGGAGSAAIVTCLARRLVTTLVREAWPAADEIESAGVCSQQDRLGKIVDLLKKDPARDYSLDSLADAAGMSRTVFHRLFTQTYGSSPLAMLRELRLKRAEELLTQTDMPIKTITARLGYRSRSHFWKLFRDAHGVDPEQFRQQGRTH
jgi:AraC-like DNA-binding protein